ncbi:hypothetical protein NGRA_1275 [Nosema granulosis]|uniref:Uncharacterized protein n=1 Tax=Nosema granulosis TaxID=83296 RepID=A0A9P6GZR1_9MICR|nr:hypothetical protein NGRA_1275 [Nosema granulosis]
MIFNKKNFLYFMLFYKIYSSCVIDKEKNTRNYMDVDEVLRLESMFLCDLIYDQVSVNPRNLLIRVATLQNKPISTYLLHDFTGFKNMINFLNVQLKSQTLFRKIRSTLGESKEFKELIPRFNEPERFHNLSPSNTVLKVYFDRFFKQNHTLKNLKLELLENTAQSLFTIFKEREIDCSVEFWNLENRLQLLKEVLVPNCLKLLEKFIDSPEFDNLTQGMCNFLINESKTLLFD